MGDKGQVEPKAQDLDPSISLADLETRKGCKFRCGKEPIQLPGLSPLSQRGFAVRGIPLLLELRRRRRSSGVDWGSGGRYVHVTTEHDGWTISLGARRWHGHAAVSVHEGTTVRHC